MFVLSFFSAKGGTGKTTFNMSMASYLKYSLGRRVLLLDADPPEYSLFNSRERELAYRREHGGVDEEKLYPVWKVKDTRPEGIDVLAGKLSALESGFDFVIVDFPGSLDSDDAIWRFAKKKILNLVVIPVDMDPMALASATQLAEVFRQTGQQVLVFFNKVHGKIAPAKYDAVEAVFRERGIAVSPHRIKQALAMSRDSGGTLSYLRSTIDFPEKTVRELNPQMTDLFNEVVRYEERENTSEKAFPG